MPGDGTSTGISPTGNQGAPLTPSPSLPKGGGAIRGIGEKFSANPVTGTGSLTVPIATSPGRSGFGPHLILTYDSGAGNGPFGFGWTLSLASISRKTDKGLPRYVNTDSETEQSDVFMLSGMEDLVPVLNADGTTHADEATHPDYRIQRYRPRIEGGFARIERWTRKADEDVHWRSTSRDNILTVYGSSGESRIADPLDARRVFSWLICETRDDRGNAVMYEYKSEDGTSVTSSLASERNRGDPDDIRRTANRYLKRIVYGNRRPLLDENGHRPSLLADLPATQTRNIDWLFEVVLDYGEHDDEPTPHDSGSWHYRNDPFSTYRPGFEVRTTRLCQRVLMFHHIPALTNGQPGYDGLVRSTDLTYSHELKPLDERNPVYTFLRAAVQTGWRHTETGYIRRSLPALEFEYTEPAVQDEVERIGPESLESLPVGVDGAAYQWVDLNGEGIAGILTERSDAWVYKRNMSPLRHPVVEFAEAQLVGSKPTLTLANGQAEFMDLAGDGHPDVVTLRGSTPGFYERNVLGGWGPFRPFDSFPTADLRDGNTRFVDLAGDGRADVLVTEDDALVWYPSLGEGGFGPGRRAIRALDEEKGPRVVFSDTSESVHIADLSGDGLSDLVRIRNGEVCYWPSLGYGRFGPKITMDAAPIFDSPDQFDPKRIRLADIDGSGTTDVIYLHRSGVRLYFNLSGNGWSKPRLLSVTPHVDDLVSVQVADLLGNGTACLVWSSPLPADSCRPMSYVNLMGASKPHLLVRSANNLGAETIVHYVPSTRFSLGDERAGTPWVTRLPFPVHVVDRVETVDRISGNHFLTRYAYHDGHFDGEEREFRGFGMVEQWDTEQFSALAEIAHDATNVDAASHVPPVLTKTWFHTGAITSGQPPLPAGLTADEEREAVRALKGSMLRQEIYALDESAAEPHPYRTIERRFTVRVDQRRGRNRHAVCFSHAAEVVTTHSERDPLDPRIQHALTLEIDQFGNVTKEALVGYGRRQPDSSLPLDTDQHRQAATLLTYSEYRLTGGIDDVGAFPFDYRTPLPCETRTWELTGYVPSQAPGLFTPTDFVTVDGRALAHDFDEEIAYEEEATGARQRRLIEHTRTLYRTDDLNSLAPLGMTSRLALPGEGYQLAFTPGLLATVFRRDGQALIPDPAALLGGGGGGRGGYVSSETLKADGRFPATDPEGHWWVPGGRVFYSPEVNDAPVQELAHARDHFFLARRSRSPFHTEATRVETAADYDEFDLLVTESRDAVGNRVTVGERKPDGTVEASRPGNDYRVLQPGLVTDANRNRSAVAYDALGLVVGTAVMGKAEDADGDSLDGFEPDLDPGIIDDYFDEPFADEQAILGGATTRQLYDLLAFQRTRQGADTRPTVTSTLAREIHSADVAPGDDAAIRHTLTYSDGFGREIQMKTEAESGTLVEGGPVIARRWVGSGWTIYNNMGKPVRQFEPFFSGTHRFESAVIAGVSSVLFYDPVQRLIATLHPNRTYQKVVFDAWHVSTWDANDTVADDPRVDADIAGITAGYFTALLADEPQGGWQTWHAERAAGDLGPLEKEAAVKAMAHARTPTTAHLDTLGRPFLTLLDNGPAVAAPGEHILFPSRVELDIEGNQRTVRDAIEPVGDPSGRVISRYAYDLLGNRIRSESMDAGVRWMLNDVTGGQIRAWDSRGHTGRTEYDALRRRIRSFVTGARSDAPQDELLTERLVYGEQHPDAESFNLRRVLHLHFDQAGVATTREADFKGNLISVARRFFGGSEYRDAFDWRPVDSDRVALPTDASAPLDEIALEAAIAPRLDPGAYVTLTTYDALNRPTLVTTPHTLSMVPTTYRRTYNPANLLERVEANVRGAESNGTREWTPFVTGIDYDAKGQRLGIAYGNATSTRYHYDPLTFRLMQVITERDTAVFPGESRVQELNYSYDPVGNITHVRDDAQQTIFFRNRRVEPSSGYTYDALYRLIEATGREHLGQLGGAPVPHSHNDVERVGIDWAANDGNVMGAYVETFTYDAVGNIGEMRHLGSDPLHPGWTRRYAYNEASFLSAGGPVAATGNRLSSTTVGNAPAEHYAHDPHGNISRMPHLGGVPPASNMHWDYRDQLARTDGSDGGVTYYVYDSVGKRVRTVWERSATHVDERIYIGGFEVFRRRRGAERLERETVHVMDDERRIALIETRTVDTAGTDQALAELTRFQLVNHLGSAMLELDDRGRIITYEEYSPYGNTTYQAVRDTTETPKRYRYTGKERDEQTGLYFHGARYYAPWLARWTACDPAGSVDGPNLYVYAKNEPTNLVDDDGRQAGPWEPYARMQRVQQAVNETFGPALKAVNSVTSQVVEGEFHEGETTWGGVVGNVITGVIPGVGQVADARDTSAAAKKVWNSPGSLSSWASLGMAGIGWIPLFGDAIKGGGKVGKKVLNEGAEGVEHALKATAENSVKVEKAATEAANNSAGVVVAGQKPPHPLAGVTDEEINRAVNGPGASGVMVSAPAENLRPLKTKPYGEGGQYMEYSFDAKTSVPGASGNVKTTLKVHDADPTAPLGSNSRSGPTLGIEQGKGNRRVVPDPASTWGGRWVERAKATVQEWSDAHIPLFWR